jgi:hypothetical protein
VRVLTHLGADSVRVEGQSAPIELNSGSGNDIVIIGRPTALAGDGGADGGVATRTLNVFSSDITISDTPDSSIVGTGDPADHDILTIDDGADAGDNIGELTSDQLSALGLGGAIRYSGFNTVNLQLGAGNDTLRVRSTAAAVAYNVNAGAGNDLIRLGSLGADLERGEGTVNATLGAMTLVGQSGKNTVVIDDSGETANSSATVTDSLISGLGMANVVHAGFGQIELLLGSGNDTVTNNLSADSGIELLLDLGAGD